MRFTCQRRLSISMALILGACTLPAQLPNTRTAMSAADLHIKTESSIVVSDSWWTLYNEPQLDALVNEALQANPKLEILLENVHAARAMEGLETGGLKPSIGVDVNSQRDRFSEFYIYPPPYGGSVFWNSTAAIGAGWSPDLFGLQRAKVNAAAKQAVSLEYRYRSAKTVLVSGLVIQLLELDNVEQSKQLVKSSMQLLDDKINLMKKRERAGLDNTSTLIELDSARQGWSVRFNELESAEQKLRHGIAIMLGRNPNDAATINIKLNDRLMPSLPTELSADLLLRRADLKAARAQIESNEFKKQASKAAFYPIINLTALAGYQSLSLQHFLTAPARTLGFGPDISLPLYDAGRLNFAYLASHSELNLAIAEYNETVLNALKDVADDIHDLKKLEAQVNLTDAQLKDAEQLLNQYRHREAQGLISHMPVLDAQMAFNRAQWEALSAKTQLAQQKVSLLVALGGPPESLLHSHPEVVP